jgi:DNA-binding Lrp family transcriptional regulator
MLNVSILLKTLPTKVDSIVEEINKKRGIRKCFITLGRFDIVAFLESESYIEVKKITSEINGLEGVRSTETLVEA